jgi:hypothetical protein
MEIFDKKGRLIFPDTERFRKIAAEKGIIAKQKKILIQQVYCSNGHQLVHPQNPKFDNEPGIHIICEGETIWQSVYLSPFQGDRRKEYKKEFKMGEVLQIFCPECHTHFPRFAPHDCQADAMYLALFLDQEANFYNTVCVCNVWGCYASFLRLAGEIFSEVRSQI